MIPTRNEATIIRVTLERLLTFLNANIREDWRVVVADNASTDATRGIVRDIAAIEPRVELLEIPEAGKGGAVLAAWQHALERSQVSGLRSQVFTFMDADLATDLEALPTLISAIRNGADIAIGSRYLPNSHTERGAPRRITSWCYRVLLRALFGLCITDPPCGFKAINARVVHEIVPRIRDTQWFFDTELLIRAQRVGMHIAEIPVVWHEPRRNGSLGKVIRIAVHDLRAMMRLLCARRS